MGQEIGSSISATFIFTNEGFLSGIRKIILNSDVFVCTDVYPAREEPIPGVTGELIAEATRKFGHKNVHYIADKKDIPAFLNEIKKDDDIIVTMGAGDIWKYGEQFVGLLNKKMKNDFGNFCRTNMFSL